MRARTLSGYRLEVRVTMAPTGLKLLIVRGAMLFPLALSIGFLVKGVPDDIPGLFNIFLALVLFVSFYHSERYGLLLWIASLPVSVIYLYPNLSLLRMSLRLASYTVATLLFWNLMKRLRDNQQVIADALARCRVAELKYRSLFEDAPIGYFEADVTGVVWEVNSTACRMLGLDRDQIIGRPLWEKVVPEEQAQRRVAALANFSGQQQLPPFAYTYLAGEESKRIETTEMVMTDAAGNVTGLRCALTDVSERHRLERHLAQAQKMESIGAMAGGVAHDFNNMLTVILGSCEIGLRECAGNAVIQEYLVAIRKAAEGAASLTHKLLSFSRRRVLRTAVVNPNALVTENLDMLRRLIGEDVEISFEPGADLGNVVVDANEMAQVLLNLAANSRDAMPNGGKISIRTSNVHLDHSTAAISAGVPAGAYVGISFSDTGEGMDEETKARALEPFYTTKEAGRGTGLGLSTCLGIVRQCGGFLSIRSRPGQGTTVDIYLPQTGQPVTEDAPEQRSVPPRPNRETILVAEDEPEVRALVGKTLQQEGYNVLTASGGLDAIEISRKHDGPIHLLITDVVMPGFGGVELTRKIALSKPGLKVLYISGYTPDAFDRRQIGTRNAALSFLGKPFTPTDLTRKVQKLLASHARSILVVDDDQPVREYFGRVLREAGYRVQEAANGIEALIRIRENVPDLLIMDLVMPEMEGLESIRAVRADHPNLKILAVSGALGGNFLEIAQLLGANQALKKPVLPDALLKSANALIGNNA